MRPKKLKSSGDAGSGMGTPRWAEHISPGGHRGAAESWSPPDVLLGLAPLLSLLQPGLSLSRKIPSLPFANSLETFREVWYWGGGRLVTPEAWPGLIQGSSQSFLHWRRLLPRRGLAPWLCWAAGGTSEPTLGVRQAACGGFIYSFVL